MSPNFDPDMVALAPYGPMSSETNHIQWTSVLCPDLRGAITTDFDTNFKIPKIDGIQNKGSGQIPHGIGVAPGKYPTLLERIYRSGMLAWRPDGVHTTPLAALAKELCVTIFAVTKCVVQHSLISWPQRANLFALQRPKPDFPHPKPFRAISVDQKAAVSNRLER